MIEPSIYVCQVHVTEGVKHYVTLLTPEVVGSRGLVPEAIVGVLLRPPGPGETITPEGFARNSVFMKFMHEVIARDGPNQPECQAEANRLGNGWIYIVDRRTKTPQGPVPPEDLIGAFQANCGKVLPGSYRPSPKYAILTKDGFFRLPSGLHQCLLRELQARGGAG